MRAGSVEQTVLVKKLGCGLLVVVVGLGVVAGFFALAAWLVVRGDDQSGLTRRVPVVLLHPEEVGSGTGSRWKFDYAYEADGRWYGYSGYLAPTQSWSPADGAAACLDPKDPRRHVLSRTRPCGIERTDGSSIQTATPRPAPRRR